MSAASFMDPYIEAIARYSKEHADLIKQASVEQIVAAFRKLQPPVPHSTQVPASPPPKSKPKGRSTKAAVEAQRWITVSEFRHQRGGEPICSYSPQRGKDLGKVCGAPCVFVDEDDLLNRCSCDVGKAGVLAKTLGKMPASKQTAPITPMLAALSLMPSAAPASLQVATPAALKSLQALTRTPITLTRAPRPGAVELGLSSPGGIPILPPVLPMLQV